MLASEHDVYDFHEIEEIDEFPMAAEYDMPRHGLGGIFGDILDIGTAVTKNYLGLTQPKQQQPQPQMMQAPPQYVVQPPQQQLAIQQAQQSLLQMPYQVMPRRPYNQPSFWEENALPIMGMGGLALVLVIVASRRK